MSLNLHGINWMIFPYWHALITCMRSYHRPVPMLSASHLYANSHGGNLFSGKRCQPIEWLCNYVPSLSTLFVSYFIPAAAPASCSGHELLSGSPAIFILCDGMLCLPPLDEFVPLLPSLSKPVCETCSFCLWIVFSCCLIWKPLVLGQISCSTN